MIIKANPNKDINTTKINNYKIIYQKIKEEIKSVVITKLLNQVQTLSNNYQKLLKENSLIKNDLIYILKRILLNKKDYINITNNVNSNKNYQIKSLYSMPYFSNSSFLNCKSYNSILSTDNLTENNNRLNNSLNKRKIDKRRYSIDDDTKIKNNSSINNNLENSNQINNIQNKIDHYLNSLYRHNFSEENISGTTSIHLLTKDKPLYEELFSKKNKNYPHLKTEYNFRKISNKKNRKKLMSEDRNNDTNIKTDNQNDYNKNIKIKKNNNFLKVQRKNNINKNKNCQNRANTNIKLVNSDSKLLKNMENQIQIRSRFLPNKFKIK